MYVQAIGPGDHDRVPVVGNGRPVTKLGRREDAGFTEITLARADPVDPDREQPDLVESVELSDPEPVISQDGAQFGMVSGALPQLLEHNLRRPAFLVNQKTTKNVQPIRPRKWPRHMASSTQIGLTGACVTARCPPQNARAGQP